MILLLSSLALLLYVWVLYPSILWVITPVAPRRSPFARSVHNVQNVSVVIAAHNEAANLPERVRNIYDCDYPQQLIEVIVASDGSTDATKDVCADLASRYPALRLIDLQPQRGRANAHNCAALECRGEILIFSDADTRFDAGTIPRMIEAFAEDGVGFVSGELRYGNEGSTDITESVGLYWRFERVLRDLENRLGLFVFGTGACCAVRRSLFKPIPPTGDVDFTTPLDVVLQGSSCVHRADVIAWDTLPETPQREFRARVRMTAKNLHGTVARWGIRGVLMHPLYTLVILSHKIGRWLTPFGMLGTLVGTMLLLPSTGAALFLAVQLAFYLLASAGGLGIRLPLAGSAYSFCLANLGFLIGVLKAATGKVPRAYRPMNQ